MHPTHWGLTVPEWLTIAAIIVGPVLAVSAQLWIQARKAKRDLKLWVFNTLMGLRANFLNPTFVQAFNLVDVVFYECPDIRKKREEFMAAVARGRGLTEVEVDRCRDLMAEMLAKMGKELGLSFDHTQIKDSGYYPIAFGDIETSLASLRQKSLDVLNGRANIGIVIRTEEPPARMRSPWPDSTSE